MARKHFSEQSEFPYHITARCLNKEWFTIPMDEVWEVFQEQLFFLHHAFNFEIHSFVLMNNHFHMIARTPGLNLSTGMRWFMKETSRYINQLSGRINQVWGGRYFRSRIECHHYYLNAYKYIYNNPVHAGYCTNVIDYKYSSLRGLLGIENQIIPIVENTLFDMGPEETLHWLNMPIDPKHMEDMRKALKRSVFKLTRNRNTKKENELEILLL